MNSFGPATRLLTLRRATGHRPVIISAAKLPSSLTRWITIRPPNEAPGEGPGSNSNTNISAPGSSSSASGSSDFQLVNHSLSISSSTSQHPFSEVLSNSGDPSSSSTVVTTSNPHSRSSHLPPPPDDIDPIPPTHFQHPFDTHAFVSYLEKSGLNSGSAVTLMHAVRELIVRRGEITKMNLVGKEDMENGAYLFRAALSELRTELSVRARSDGEALKAMSGAIRRGVDSLEQKMREDAQTLKHDVEMDMNNRKSETRSEMKGFEITIEEINNKFTISLGDLRTEIESAKWDATRRAISIIVLIVVAAIAVSTLTGDDRKAAKKSKAAATPASTSPKPVMRDMAAGPDHGAEDDYDDESDDDAYDGEADDTEEAVSEEKLEKILKESGIEVPVVRPPKEGKRKVKPKEKKEKNDVPVVDRI